MVSSIDREKVIKGLEHCRIGDCVGCPYDQIREESLHGKHYKWELICNEKLTEDILSMLKEQDKEIKALHLLVEWAEECDFGFDQFPDEYERYKDEIKGMEYIDGMIHVAKRTLEDNGAFEEGR